jgi:hypothetical protein
MDTWLLAGAASLAVFLAACLFVPQLLAGWRRRKVNPFNRRSRLILPPASETTAAITRFRRAVLHSDLADYFRPD